MLSLEVFKYLVELFQIPDIDMFPSRLNKQLPKYASWMPDPESYIIDCMSTSWENTYIYAFPKLSMRWPTINKIEKEAEKALINCTNVANTDMVHRGTRISNSNTYNCRESTSPSARYQQTTPTFPEAEDDGHMLLQE